MGSYPNRDFSANQSWNRAPFDNKSLFILLKPSHHEWTGLELILVKGQLVSGLFQLAANLPMTATATVPASATAMKGAAAMEPASKASAAMKTTATMETAETAMKPAKPSTKSSEAPAPSPSSADYHRPTITIAAIAVIRPTIVIRIVRVAISIIRIIRANHRHVRRWRGRSRNLHGRLSRHIPIGPIIRRRLHGPRHRLLLIILLIARLLLLLQLAVADEHGLGNLLRQTQSPQIDDFIGVKVVRHRCAVDEIDDYIFVDTPLIHLHHFIHAVRQDNRLCRDDYWRLG